MKTRRIKNICNQYRGILNQQSNKISKKTSYMGLILSRKRNCKHLTVVVITHIYNTHQIQWYTDIIIVKIKLSL